MSREEEYKQKCRQVKDYYLEEICEHEDAGWPRGCGERPQVAEGGA